MVKSKQGNKRGRFHGNRFTNNTKQKKKKENEVVTQQTVCTSARKLKKWILMLWNLIITVI